MAKRNTKAVEDEDVLEESLTSEIDSVKENKDEQVIKEVKQVKKKDVEPLTDSDEIEVESLIPNVSYKDSKTGDMYEWDNVGHIEYMTFEILKNMWRNNKGYFRNMWLKPCDDRVINKFGLTKVYKDYDFLMESSNYTRDNIDDVCDSISKTPIGLKYSICNKIKDLVINGEVTDIKVVRTLEKRLDLDLVDFL